MDTKDQTGGTKLNLVMRRQCLHEVGIVVDDNVKSDGLRKLKIDLTIEEVADDMKLSLWRAMQGIKDEQLFVSVLSRLVAKEISVEEMVTEFNK